MDYCALGSIKDVMKITQDVLTERHAGYIIQQTLIGLCNLHSQNILHLDVKAANILITQKGEVKLADFGVSEQLRDVNTFIEANDYVGSPLFMAPEVIRKDKYNDRADIWSLGITTIEMVEGRPPNTDINCIEKLPELLYRDPPKFQKQRSYSYKFNNFLQRCLVKNMEARPSAMDLLTHDFMVDRRSSEDIKELIMMASQLKEAERSRKRAFSEWREEGTL